MTIFSTIIILLYFIFLFKIKKKKKISIIDLWFFKLSFGSKKYYYDIFIIMLFIIFYIGFFRLMKLFRDEKHIDFISFIKFITLNLSFNYILLFIVIIFFLKTLKEFLIFYLKISFLDLSYLFQAQFEWFPKIFLFIINWHHDFWYCLTLGKRNYPYKKRILNCIYYFFKYIGLIILSFCFIFDCIFNNYILYNFCFMLPWISLYQTFYLLNRFFDNKINIKYEFLASSSLYIDYLHNLKLLKEYNNSKKRISFDAYKNISQNLLKDNPPKIDKITLSILNTYLISILD